MKWEIRYAAVLAICLTCCSSDDNAPDPEPGSDAGRSDSGHTGSGGAADASRGNADSSASGQCSGCSESQGCVKIVVTVSTDSARLPYKEMPNDATGTGRLLAGIYLPGMSTVAKDQDGVKLSSFEGATFELCSAPGTAQAFCFLDDSADGSAVDVSGTLRPSDDYRDTCSSNRQLSAAVTTGKASTVACALSVSCD